MIENRGIEPRIAEGVGVGAGQGRELVAVPVAQAAVVLGHVWFELKISTPSIRQVEQLFAGGDVLAPVGMGPDQGGIRETLP